jgi:hypothetical protein
MRGVVRSVYREIAHVPKRKGMSYLYVLNANDDVMGIRYIGKTVQAPITRLHKHIADSALMETHCHRWIRSVLQSGKEPQMRIIATIPSQYAAKAEMRLISALRKSGVQLTNLTDGGEGKPGHRVSQETKDKISRAHKGVREVVPQTEETRRRKSEWNNWRWAQPGTRERHSELLKGKIFSAERRRKISEALSGKVVPIEVRYKIASALRNKKQSEETKRKRSESLRRYYSNPEAIEKMRMDKQMAKARKEGGVLWQV